MDVRRAHFPDDVYFFLPSLKHYETLEVSTPERARFVPVSVTGSSCQLMCEHCRGKILDSMFSVDGPGDLLELGTRLARHGVRGLLITGGSDARGVVPLRPFADAIKELKGRHDLRVVVHTGLLDREDARSLAGAGIDAGMLDIIGSDDTVREVYHLDAGTARFEESLSFLVDEGVPVSPHVVVGIHFGQMLGETSALEMISRFPIASLVVVVLSPLPDTPMEHVRPFTGSELSDLFTRARSMFPSTPILLGCARPEGRERYGIDEVALLAGFNGIAFPAEGIVAAARGMGLRPVVSPDCCSLIFTELA
jgi:uncharacterized radical SAM superfamily protein